MGSGFDKAEIRVLRFLAAGEAHLEPCGTPGRVKLVSGVHGVVAVEEGALAGLVRAGQVVVTGLMAALTAAGRAAHARLSEAERPFLAQHAELGTATIEREGRRETVLANLSESPLSQIARRKGRDGRAFLDADQVAAGERLRRDYTFGLLTPRTAVNWDALSNGGTGPQGRGAVELTDGALAARRRVDDALEAVGPELAGLLVDVCCFLKGLEAVEAERGWPVRSAKVVLRTALSALARHYAPERRRAPGRVLHWGAADYRPRHERR